MQYVGRAIGSVSKTWSSINPATLSGAIDIIVVEQDNGDLSCSPFHVRFGKFQLLRPSQKKVDFIVNGEITDLPMKLGDGGEAFFVFETDGYIPPDLQTSPVLSPESSPSNSPKATASSSPVINEEPDFLDIGEGVNDGNYSLPSIKSDSASMGSTSPSKLGIKKSSTTTSLARAQEISKKLTKKNIPSKVDANGDLMLDMQGYKSNAKDIEDSDSLIKQLLQDEFGEDVDIASIIAKDLHGNIRIDLGEDSETSTVDSGMSSPNPILTGDAEIDLQSPGSSASSLVSDIDTDTVKTQRDNHFKTLRLTSEQLKCLSLKAGENDIIFSVNKGKAVVNAKLFLWKQNVPIVISDIDGTITKSDALGHVLTMLGRDWTHVGVAKLFGDIEFNGYNIMYLTARSVGLADTTRSYLQGVIQDGIKLPVGPVILSPDRTMAALKREIVLKKPEVFKMACLNDIRALYDHNSELEAPPPSTSSTGLDDIDTTTTTETANDNKPLEPTTEPAVHPTPSPTPETIETEELDPLTSLSSSKSLPPLSGSSAQYSAKSHFKLESTVPKTPFYAGFGNKITDALSYRTVGIPSSRIFTINPDGDVHMELLEMAGYKSSYVSIGELVDQFFPPVNISKIKVGNLEVNDNTKNQFSDLNYWRSPVLNLDDLSEDEDSDAEELLKLKKLKDDAISVSSGSVGAGTETPSSPGAVSPRLSSFFSRSPPPNRDGSITPVLRVTPENDDSFYDEDEEYDEGMDPDYSYDEEEEEDDDDEDGIDIEYDDDDVDGIDIEYEDEEDDDFDEYDDDEELDEDLLVSEELSDELNEVIRTPSKMSIANKQRSLSSIESGALGISTSRSATSLSTVDSKNVSGTFIKAKEMLNNLSLDEEKAND